MSTLQYIVHLVAMVVALPVGAFVVAVVIDDAAGVLIGLKTGTLSGKKLPSFLASQFGSQEAIALGGLLVTAYFSAPAGSDLRNVLYSAATVGASAMTVAVVADIKDKVLVLVGRRPAALPKAYPPPI